MSAFFLILLLIFVTSITLLAHTYIAYPVLMRWMGRRRPLPGDRFRSGREFPEVAVLMAVYNEEKVLAETLASILASDYPPEKLTVFIGSDGSTDRSDAIAKSFSDADPRVRLVSFGGRNGKIRIINRLAEGALTTFSDPDKAIFVLCDANVTWAGSLLRRLVSHFKRESVGLVGAAVVDRIREHTGIGDQEEAYVGQENLVKFAEGVIWGRVMGAFGACYAMRSRLFTPVPPHHIVDDFYLTLSCLEQGSDAIVDLDAVCHEAVSTDIREEFRRKRRIAAGNFQNLRRFRQYLLPWHGGPAVAFAFWSHKGLRWYGPFLLVAAMLSALALGFQNPWFLPGVGGFLALFLMAAADRILAGRGWGHVRAFRFCRYFLSMNLALFLGYLDFLRGPRTSVWEPTRRETAPLTRETPPRHEPALRK